MSTTTAATILSSAVSDIGSTLSSFLPQVITVAVGLFLVVLGFRYVKRLLSTR